MRFDPRLMYVTDDRIVDDNSFFEVLENALKGGATSIQLREKKAKTNTFYQRALRAKALCDAYHVPLIINDRADIALAVGAQGLHIGQEDLPYRQARNIMGEKALIGLSVSHVDQAIKAQNLAVDYIGISPLFTTQTKTEALEAPLGLEGLSKITRVFKGPIIVIGGLNTNNTPSAIHAGANGIAVVSAISKADDPQKATQELLNCI